MSNYYLCDYCAKKLDADHLNTCVCIPSYPREHRKKVMHDGVERPTDVCEEYERRDACPAEDD